MTTFSNTFKLITLIWLTNILSAGYCKGENSELNCTIAPQKDVQDITSREIPTVTKCAKGYANQDIIDKCELLINRTQQFEGALYEPGINKIKNVAYMNKFCATCNNDTETEFEKTQSWHRYFYDDPCAKLRPRMMRSEVDDIYNLIQVFANEGVKLEAKFYDKTQLECSMDGKWPLALLFFVNTCLVEDFQNGQIARLLECQYAEKTGKICIQMKLFLEGFDFEFQDRKKINNSNRLTEYKNFTPGQYYQETSYPGVFYICDLPGTIYGGQHSVKISIVVISLILLAINLGINSNKRYLQQNNTYKLLYLYMLGLVPMIIILLLVYLSHPVPCVAFYLAKFLWVYHFFWSMLIFIEFCLLAFCTLHNAIVSDIPLLGLRYIFYFIFGFAIPFALPIIHYFGVLVLNENYKEDISQGSIPVPVHYTCPIIPNHLGVYCTSSQHFGSKYYEDWLKTFLSSSFSLFLPTFFLLISGVVLYYFLNYRSAGIRSIPYRDHLMVLTKMTVIMGIHWLLFKIYSSYGKDYSTRVLGVSLDTLCQLSIDLHGIVVFLVFGAETCVGFVMIMLGCEYKSVSQQDRNDDMEI